jgi:uncharacterized DUF497 family protein
MFTFDWDENKAKSNLRKHGVSFVEAVSIFEDQRLVTFPDEAHSQDEERLISIGLSHSSRILLAVYTESSSEIIGTQEVIRIISCRKATPLEREIYEENY